MMVRTIFIISFLVALTSCGKKEQEITQQNIVGLWEIDLGDNWPGTDIYGNSPNWLGDEKSQLELSSDNSFSAKYENELASFGTYQIIGNDIIFYADSLSPCLIPGGCNNSGPDQYPRNNEGKKLFTLEEIQSNRFIMRGDDSVTFGVYFEGYLYRYKRK